MKINEIELELKAKGYRYLAGIDEAGRGPLAGPVVAAAVVFPEDVAIDKINDSKKLSPRIREELYEQILKYAHVGIGIASVSEIDQYNILKATLLAMKRSVDDLPLRPDFCLIDGNQGIPDLFIPQNTVVQGDRTCFCIAAASIVAKVTRDRLMLEYDAEFSQYGFAKNKGYPTKEHKIALQEHGPSPIHRMTFAGVKRGISK